MEITLIRHGKVDMEWSGRYTSQTFDRACLEYDLAHIKSIDNAYVPAGNLVYISNLIRSSETAQALFPGKEFIESDDIGEVPLRSFADWSISLPVWVWNVMGRIQWYFNIDRQKEGRYKTIKRADSVIAELEKRKTDCVLITHGFFMKTLISRLKRAGYRIKGQTAIGFGNLQGVTAEKEL